MVVQSRIRVFDPTAEAQVESGRLAPRPGTLDGKVIGLYSNNKTNATRLLDMVGALLSERFSLKGVVRGTYNSARVMRKDEWRDVDRCDAIILTHGD